MRISLRGAAITAAASGLVMLGAMPAAAGSVSKQYVGGAGDGAMAGFTPASKDCGSTDPGVNGACALYAGGDFDVTINDATGQKMNAIVSFKDGSAAAMSTLIPVCGTAHITNAPDGAAAIWIRVGAVGRTGGVSTGDPTNPTAPSATLPCGVPSAPTTGTITFSGPGVGASASSFGYNTSRTYRVAVGGDATGHYVSAPGDVATLALRASTLNPALPDVGFGGIGFDVTGSTSINVKVADATGRSVNATVGFRTTNLNGKTVGTDVVLCGGSKDNIPVPDGATYAFVTVPTTGIIVGGTSFICGAANGATAGTITVGGNGGSRRAASAESMAAQPSASPAVRLAAGHRAVLL